MTRRQIFVRGTIAGILVGLMLQAVNWLYSAHPEASDFRRFTVIVQAVLSAIGAIWLARGIPGEPDIAAQRVAEIADPRDSQRALSNGQAVDAVPVSAAIAPSPIPHHRHS
jgi:hypothetical protein